MVDKINVALIGIGDVSSALVQGCANYKKNPDKIIGLLPEITQYNINDIISITGVVQETQKYDSDYSKYILGIQNVNFHNGYCIKVNGKVLLHTYDRKNEYNCRLYLVLTIVAQNNRNFLN